ncbi:hypothetical protein MKUB_43840 [Mycobacterium kubicae]|uniref:Uncharacterized protein n=1 Tax=Mycobacterium kubicae TaxID=120959 RepID=A0AAX1J9C0_9MYCO|nr:hypothetical protein [Mycobacterium kubicae]MCV7095395.1 hypothetical protein [Mycobacterium kubicae]ORW06256.1 hypothetical protein AWC13_00060 [Mycobacterium kubicae]QNI13528.1 hypothetical protein GAN18_22325 [Mycobacterium kubicae]QPI37045.1 hypothetical protein I2456_21905 [Mycobacterium kubicae]GFG66894.1 hypothetical protein MKUB_43840 [Mycobacterium kubicae]
MMKETAAQNVPLVTLAAELDQPVTVLAARCADHVTIAPETGLRVVHASVCRKLIEQRAAAIEADQQRRRDLATRLGAPVAAARARRHAIDARHAEMRANGEVGAGAQAVDFLFGARVNDERLAAASARMDGYLRGESVGYRISPPPRPRTSRKD